MRLDLHVMELIWNRGNQELVRAQAPQLEAVRHITNYLIGKADEYRSYVVKDSEDELCP